MGLLEDLKKEQSWRSFYEYKLEKQHLTKQDEQALLYFIEEKRYLKPVQKLLAGNMCFDYPTKKLVNKMNSTKKRTVYMFAEEETWILKLMSYLLFRYDALMPDNLYSFRKKHGVKQAIRHLVNTQGIDEMYYYKVDISNYFNSIDINLLLPMLRQIMKEDMTLYSFFENLLTADLAYYEGSLIQEKRGIMAGCPIAPFLANVYLMELDRQFHMEQVVYARYSDDIICFAKTQSMRDTYRDRILQMIEEKGLSVNPEKEKMSAAGQMWEFLGFSYQKGQIDLSDATLQKMKGKIRRKARAIYRWRVKKNVPETTAMKTFIRIFNHKFFDAKDANDLTWSRWFFPIINVDTSLKVIDEYMQQYIRYIATGRHSRINYRVDYEKLKECGYRCLVNEYYKPLTEIKLKCNQ